MTNEEIKNELAGYFPDLSFDESGEWMNILAVPTSFPALPGKLRGQPSLLFDYLFCLTCIDWKTHLTMVYHLTSTIHRHTVVLKSNLDRNQPEIESVAGIWLTAEFHEREVYELFGVKFLNHPDLRLLILPDGWEGRNPLRKDFEDPVNMIRL